MYSGLVLVMGTGLGKSEFQYRYLLASVYVKTSLGFTANHFPAVALANIWSAKLVIGVL